MMSSLKYDLIFLHKKKKSRTWNKNFSQNTLENWKILKSETKDVKIDFKKGKIPCSSKARLCEIW